MHLRAVCGGSLKKPRLQNKAAMHNLIGQIHQSDYSLAAKPYIHLYDYNKKARKNRKVGHWVEVF